MTNLNLQQVLHSVIRKAEEDNIITVDERALIEALTLEVEEIEREIEALQSNNETSSALNKLLASSGKVLLRNLVSKAREDGKLTHDEMNLIEQVFAELGYDITNFNPRPWFNFKICLNIDEKTDMGALLNHFDKVFCLRGIDPNDVYAGLCLGTKHYVIDDIDVTLLTFAVTPNNDQDWVTKGAFATLDFDPNFERTLYTTAHDLAVEYYFAKM